MTKTTTEGLRTQAAAFAEYLRQYVRDQAASWRRVPWEALRASALGGSTVEMRRAYKFGYWHVCPTLAVDCATGELYEFRNEDPRPATDQKLLEYASRLQIFDGAAVIAKLRAAADDGLKGLPLDDVETRREALEEERAKFRLTKRYEASMRLPLPPPEPIYTGTGD